jgi:MFS family permease
LIDHKRPDRLSALPLIRKLARVPLNRNIIIFLLGAAVLGIAGGVFEGQINNYLAEVFDITAGQRGQLEIPRELPGLMVAVLAGVLFFAGEATLAVVAAGLYALGMVGLALAAGHSWSYGHMIAFLVLWSTGAHLMMPVRSSLALALAGEHGRGAKLAKLSALTSVAMILGFGIVWLNFEVVGGSYTHAFLIGAGFAGLAALAFFILRGKMPPIHHGKRPRLVIRGRYRLFYVLSVLYGARKQLAITFAPWVLVRIYQRPPQSIALLWIIAKVLTILLLPLIGRLIDRFGERLTLMIDALLLLVVCLAYGFAGNVFPYDIALLVVCGAYITDQLLFPVQIARTTYLSKIAADRRDVTASLGLSVSIDHAVSIPMAVAGGMLWMRYDDHRPVFAVAVMVAVAIFFASSLVKIPPVREEATLE